MMSFNDKIEKLVRSSLPNDFFIDSHCYNTNYSGVDYHELYFLTISKREINSFDLETKIKIIEFIKIPDKTFTNILYRFVIENIEYFKDAIRGSILQSLKTEPYTIAFLIRTLCDRDFCEEKKFIALENNVSDFENKRLEYNEETTQKVLEIFFCLLEKYFKTKQTTNLYV